MKSLRIFSVPGLHAAWFGLLFCLATAQATLANSSVIYGADGIIEAYQTSNPKLQAVVQATAARIAKSTLRSRYLLKETLADSSQKICRSERFADQPNPAECTGFLVGPDLLLTAGHCTLTQADCTDNDWVFDFGYESSGKFKPFLNSGNRYRCKHILTSVVNEQDPLFPKWERGKDYGLIRLDRIVTNRTPLSISKAPLTLTTPIAVVGHPIGLPAKIALGGAVRHLLEGMPFFTGIPDTFGGNSGSPVVNTTTGEVVGILVRGESDFEYDAGRGCSVYKHCENNACRGEDISKITQVGFLQKGLRDSDFFEHAIRTGSTAWITEAINAGVDPYTFRSPTYREPAIHVAARHGRMESLQALAPYFSSYLDGWETEDAQGRTAFQIALDANEMNASQYLLAYVSDINHRDHNGNSLLHYAIQAEALWIVKTLVAKKCNIAARNHFNETPLHTAVQLNLTDYVKLLVKQGAPIRAKNVMGKTPLDYAQESNKEILDFLKAEVVKQH